jgi:hypothetical protein
MNKNQQDYSAGEGETFVVVVPPSNEPTEVRVTLRGGWWRRRLAFAFDNRGAFAMPETLLDTIQNPAA